MFSEEWKYYRFAIPYMIDKELHTLEGILKGISVDNMINSNEVNALLSWCKRHHEVSQRSPFNELIPMIKQALQDGVIDEEEKQDIIWLCQNFTTPNEMYDAVTSDMQRLQGILSGIVADGKITEDEIYGLQKWLEEHEKLRSIWPYDEIDSLITEVMRDGVIDKQEHKMLVDFCRQFSTRKAGEGIDPGKVYEFNRTGVCAVAPEITIKQKTFCLTGNFKNGTKNRIAEEIISFDGLISKNVRMDIDYLVVGGSGSECWAFSCYGRKVEKVVNFRKNGIPIVIVHEFDLWDSLEDLR